jgi:sigma-B regulation protein RsbU (phosphoserine phosphatase)
MVTSAQKAQTQDETIVFTPQWTAQAQFAGYYVAEAKGFYREAGVKVRIEHPSPTYPAMSRLRKSIILPNDTQEVPKLTAFVDEVCEAVGFSADETSQVKVAIEEAVVNVMNYAYPPGTRGDVTIEAASNDVRLKFTIIDSGKPFDPTVQAGVDTTLPANERPIGGLGIHIVRQIMDSINYERMGNLNVLTLRKKIHQ